MKTAIVAHRPTAGGVTRFMLALLDHLAECTPEEEYVLFAHHALLTRESLTQRYAQTVNVEVVAISDAGLTDAPLPSRQGEPVERGVVWRAGRWLARRSRVTYRGGVGTLDFVRRRVTRTSRPWYLFEFPAETVAALNTCDMVYFPDYFYMEPAPITAPIVATIHDLNYKHFPANFPRDMIGVVERQSQFWFARLSTAVSSTHFIEDEVRMFYPLLTGRTVVVRLAPYSYGGSHEEGQRRLVDELGIPERYVLYPTQVAHHKNIAGLLRAMDILKSQGVRVPLVLTGYVTDLIASPLLPGDHAAALYEPAVALRQSSLVVGEDVFLMGYVSNEQVDALTLCAGLIVSPSLYEAGCGPAMDAWQFGVPVAISAIPAYVEQIEASGVQAWMFDPRDPQDIAATIKRAFDEPESTRAMVEASRVAIANYTWTDVARRYLGLFHAAADVSRRSRGE